MKVMERLGEEKNVKPSLIAAHLYRKKGLPKVCEDFKHVVGAASGRKGDSRCSPDSSSSSASTATTCR